MREQQAVGRRVKVKGGRQQAAAGSKSEQAWQEPATGRQTSSCPLLPPSDESLFAGA